MQKIKKLDTDPLFVGGSITNFCSCGEIGWNMNPGICLLIWFFLKYLEEQILSIIKKGYANL